MSSIQRYMQRANSAAAVAPDSVASLWRGTVAEVVAGGLVWVRIPRLAGDDPVGPLPALPLTLQAGDPVLVGAVEDSRADLVVVATVDPGLAGTAQAFSTVTLSEPATLAQHAVRKDYVDETVGEAVAAGVSSAVTAANGYTDAAFEALTTDVPWTDLTLSGAWVAYDGTAGHRPGLRARVKDGFLEVTGAVQDGSIMTDICTFPAGMVPAYSASRPCVARDGLGALAPAVVEFLAAGTSLSYMDGPNAPALLSINERIPMT